eukprot:sb/3465411/
MANPVPPVIADMDGLVGYGSDSSDEDETVQPPVTSPKPPITTSKPPITTPKPATTTPKPATTTLKPPADDLFRRVEEPTSSIHISDDEDAPPVPRSSSSSSVPKKILPKLSELIQRAQIVSVKSEELKVEDGSVASLLPAPKSDAAVGELELEHLRKGKRAKKDKRKKIFAIDLDDYLNEEDEEEEKKKKKERPVKPKSGSGLFSVLPQPKNCKLGSKSTRSVVTPAKPPVKPVNFLQPRTLKRPAAKKNEDENDEGAAGSSSDFFSFGKSEKETEELERAAKSVKLETYKPKPIIVNTPETTPASNIRSIDSIPVPLDEKEEEEGDASNGVDLINELGKEEEARSASKCPVQGKERSKNQIGYLAWQAKEREIELKNQWASNRANKHATQSKYGFR